MTRAAYRTTSARRLNGRRKTKRPARLPQVWQGFLVAEEQDRAYRKPDHASRAIDIKRVFPILGGV